MEHEPTPTLGDINDVLIRLEHKVDTALASLLATAGRAPVAPASTRPVAALPPPPTGPISAPPPAAATIVLPPPPPPSAAGPFPGRRPVGPPRGSAPAVAGTGRTFDLEVTPERFVRWAGLVLIVLSAIFAVSTAIQRGWIGPELQLAGATAAGLGLLGAAFRLRDHGPGWPTSLGMAGATVLVFCATATHTWLDLVPPAVALGAVGLATAVSGTAAWRLARQSVAFTAGLAALWVPPLLGLSDDLTPGQLAAGLAVAVGAATTAGLARPWPLVRTGISWLAALMLLVVLFEVDLERSRITAVPGGLVAWLAVATVAAPLWLGPTLGALRADRRSASVVGPSWFDLDGERLAALDHRLLAVVPGWCWLALTGLAGLDHSRAIGWLGLAVAAGSAALAGLAWRWLPRLLSLTQLLGVGMVTAVALVALIDGPLLMVALTVQTVATGIVAHRFQDKWMAASASGTGGLAVLLATAGILRTIEGGDPTPGGAVAQLTVVAAVAAAALVAQRLDRRDLAVPAFLTAWTGLLAWYTAVLLPLPHAASLIGVAWAGAALVLSVGGIRDRLVSAVGLATMGLAGAVTGIDLLAAASVMAPLSWAAAGGAAAVACGGALTWFIGQGQHRSLRDPAFVATWLLGLLWVLATFLPVPQGHGVISALWAGAACGAIVAGLRWGLPTVRTTGLATLALAVVKLLTVDLATVDVFWRVGLFFVVGAGLLRLAYILPRLTLQARRRVSPTTNDQP